MARRLYPLGIQTFAEIIRRKMVCVDKTAYVWNMAATGKFYFLSRLIVARYATIVVMVLMCVHTEAGAQTRSQLRDSLKVAADRLAYSPDSTDLRLKKAGYNLRLEQWAYAQDEYDYILKREPCNPAALFYRAYTNEKLHRDDFARRDYESLLTVVPGHFEGQLGLALLNQKSKRHTEALDQINRLVTQYPDNAVAYAARAGIEMEQGMVALAIFDYEEAIKRDSTNTEYRIDYTDALIRDRRTAEARKQLDELVRMGVARASLRDFYKRAK